MADVEVADEMGWVLHTVEGFAEVIGGGTPSTKDPTNFGGAVPWITPKDLSGHPSRYIASGERTLSASGLSGSSARLLPAGAVIVSSRAPIGLTAIAVRPMATNQGCRSLVLKPDVADSEFVYYLMAANTEYLHQHANGTTFMELPGGVFKRLEFLLPPLDEQRRIAALLGAVDDNINSKRTMVRTIDEAIEIEGAVALADVDDALRVPLSSLATFTNGYSYKSAELVDDSDTALVNLKNFGRHGGFRLDGLKPFAGSPKAAQFLEPGDVIVAKTDLTQNAEVVGRCLRMPAIPAFSHYVASLDIAVVRPSAHVPREALLALLAQPEFRDHCVGFTNGTTVLHMSKGALPAYEVLLPATEALPELTAKVTALAEHQDRVLCELYLLEELKRFLVPALLSGDLRVADAQVMVEGAT